MKKSSPLRTAKGGNNMAERTFGRPEALLDVPTHYCPGCHHGIIHRLVAEVIDELKVIDRTIGVASVGCSALAYDYFNVDMVQAPHGRAPAVATGIKRVHPDGVVFTYQGDGDIAAIGTAEIIHAAARGEREPVLSRDEPRGRRLSADAGGRRAPARSEPGASRGAAALCAGSGPEGRAVAVLSRAGCDG